MMAETALTRTAKALDLVPFINEHPGITIRELSEIYKTSEREISLILETIFMCGLPGYTPLELIDLSTEDGVVSIIDPQNLSNPRRLSRVEAVSIVLGLENISHLVNSDGLHTQLKSLQNKMQKILSSVEDGSVVVKLDQGNFATEEFSILQKAISEKAWVSFEYLSLGKDELTDRQIAPLRTYVQNGYTYLDGLTIDGSQRTFRWDRISHMRPSSGVIDSAKLTIKDEPILVEAIISKKNQLALEQNGSIVDSFEENSDGYKTVFKVNHLDWLIRLFMSMSGKIQILTPDDLEVALREMVERSLENYLIWEN